MLQQLERLAKGIATTFGNSCETVIHDMDQKERSVLAIYNGHVTGRVCGDAFSILGKEREIDDFLKNSSDLINCMGHSADGRHIKSSTFQFVGTDYHFSLGINFDLSYLSIAEKAIQELTRVSDDLEGKLQREHGIDALFDACLEKMGTPLFAFSLEDRIRMVELLQENQAFSIHKSIPYVARRLGVSRHTVYNYLKTVQDK